MKFVFVLLMVFSTAAQALEVDEKLTVRLVKVSESRKTVMINRGTEDGLVEGDHAKFIVTAGIIARGVLIKLSPTRSVWSLYRLVNADFILNDSVMTIKITPAVKLTKDESQTLVQEDTPSRTGSPKELGIPLAEGADDLSASGDKGMSSADLASLQGDEGPSSLVEKNKEVIGFIDISGLTANSKTDTGSASFNNSYSYHHIGLLGELYPRKEREWYSKFSATAGVNVMRQDSQAYNGSGTTNDLMEFMVGVNWHPTKKSAEINEFIPYFHGSFNFGSAKSTYTAGTETATPSSLSSNGSTSGFSAGFGYKYYISRGFGARAIVDYYFRQEKWKADDLANVQNRTVGGPRLMVGLSYRF